MKTLPVATFNERAPAEELRVQFSQAGVNAVLHDESMLERFWFMSEPLAAIHVEVPQPDYLRARKLLSEWEAAGELMKTAVHCPECKSSRVEFPDRTRKFITPALCVMALNALHVTRRQYYCLDCHFTWPKVPLGDPGPVLQGFPLDAKLWQSSRPKQQK
ncbi:MAG: hypothetical protein QM813_04175 [Verrucomicrobiota bacterium]